MINAEDMSEMDAIRAAIETSAVVAPPVRFATITATGRDRKSWLNGLVTCELATLEAGQGALGLAVAKNGKVMAELRIALGAEAILVGVLPELGADLVAHFERHLIMEDVELELKEPQSWVFLHGPKALDVARAAAEPGDLVTTLDETGRGGAAIFAGSAAAESVEAIGLRATAAGAERAAPFQWEALRVELGVPKFGVDYDRSNYPQEAALESRAVSFQKGCYLGQETVFMLQMRGHVKKRLVQLRIAGDDDVAPGTPLSDETGQELGHVTSRTPAPGGGALLALGYVKFKRAKDGEELRVSGRAARVIGLGAKQE